MSRIKTLLLIQIVLTLWLPTDSQLADEEFEIGTVEECSGTQQTIEDPRGTLIFPPTGTSNYENDCQWRLTIDTGAENLHLRLTFKSFQLGEGDTVSITDIQFGGSYDVDFMWNSAPTGDAIAAFGSIVTIEFNSDSDNSVGTGFKIKWEYEDPLGLTTPGGLPRDTVFRTVLRNRNYVLTSPNYPGNYPVDTVMYWVLSTAVDTDRVQLTFQAFQLSLDDTLSVYDGIEQSDENLLVRYTGAKKSLPKAVASHTYRILIVFDSSLYVNNKGFSISYHIFVPATPQVTTVAPPSKVMPLTPQARSALIVVGCLILLVVIIVCVYCLYWKPKQKAEELRIARELYDNGKQPISMENIPHRPTTAAEIARLRAAAQMRNDYGMGDNSIPTAAMEDNPYLEAGIHRPGPAFHRPGTAGLRPGTASQRPGTASQRLDLASQRPGTASQRLDLASQRPGTASQRLDPTSQRPGTASQRLDPTSQRLEPTSQRPGTASQKPTAAPAQNMWRNEEIPESETREKSGWSQKIEDRFAPTYGGVDTSPSAPPSKPDQPPSYSALMDNPAFTSEPTSAIRRDVLPPLDLSSITEPVKIKKRKKKKKEKLEIEDEDDAIKTPTKDSLSPHTDSDRPFSGRPGSGRPGSGRPGSGRPGSARPGSGLKTSSTAPGELTTSSKLPGYVLRPNDEDDWSL